MVDNRPHLLQAAKASKEPAGIDEAREIVKDEIERSNG